MSKNSTKTKESTKTDAKAKANAKAKTATKAKTSKANAKAKTSKAVMEPEVLSIHEKAAMQCREKIENAVTTAAVAFYDLAIGLLEAWENDYAQVWGYETFRDYVERKLDMKYRRAMYLTDVGKAIRQVGLKQEQVERIGWTKLKEIAPILQDKPEEATKYLDMAENMSTSQLKEELRAEIQVTDGKPAVPGVMRLSFKFDGDSMKLISDALNLAYSEIGKEDAESALEHMAAEWLMLKGSSTETVASLDDWIHYLEKQFSVKLSRTETHESIDAVLDDGADVNELFEDSDINKALGIE